MDTFDVVVVGGGLIGTALAYELARDGVRTALVDRHDPGRATDAGAGILSPETVTGVAPAWRDLALGAGEHYRTLIGQLRELGAPDTGYDRCGVLRLAFRECDDELYAASATEILAHDRDAITEVAPDDAATRFPPLAPIRAALFNRNGARVDGRRANAALAHAATAHGAELRSASVTGFVTRDERVGAVRTDAGELPCGAVVIAGGAWTPALGDALGVQLPVVPVRGQIVTSSSTGPTRRRGPSSNPCSATTSSRGPTGASPSARPSSPKPDSSRGRP
jgi:D-amino-acid dehydrogenase